MLTPAWKLPLAILGLVSLAVLLLPGTSPEVLGGAVVVALVLDAVLYAILLRRERRRASG